MDIKLIETVFQKLGIDYTIPGFYDSPSFVAQENKDPAFLENYADYVLKRDYPPEYLQRAEKEIKTICTLLYNELATEGRLGACVDYSMLLSRILEKRGIWNYMTKGSLTIDSSKHPLIKTKFFWSFDTKEFTSGHSWVVAPPFKILDLSIKHQPFEANERELFPDFICTQNGKPCKVKDEDLISYDLREYITKVKGINKNQIYLYLPNFDQFCNNFMPLQITENEIDFKYITVGVTAPIESLENSKIKFNGNSGMEVFHKIIQPNLT